MATPTCKNQYRKSKSILVEINIGRLTVSLIRTALFVALLGVVSACSPQKQATTDALPPMVDTQPTPTNEPVPTVITSPTQDPIVLAPFSAQLEGVGTNGTMACYTYGGNAADLDKVVLTANLSQGATKIESNIPSQLINGKTCFEVVDAKYVSVNPADGTLLIPDSTVKLEINATSPEGKPVTNSKQTLDLGQYVQFPFLGWIYDTQKVCRNNQHEGYIAWDFIPYSTPKNPTIINTPVLAPTDGIIYAILSGVTNSGTNASVMIYSPSTGYLIDLTHEASVFVSSDQKIIIQSDQSGKTTNLDEIVGVIGAKDDASGIPHTHMEIKIPSHEIDFSKDPSEIANLLWSYVLDHTGLSVDFIKSHLFLDESLNNYLSNLPNNADACGILTWGTLTLPTPTQQLSFTIDGKADDWAGYTPVLTDSSEDSQAASIMDFTELYTAKDDNYLYIMLKSGNNNGSKLWAAQFFVNTDDTSRCEGADKLITLDAGTPDAILISDIKSCSDTGSPAAYAGGQFAWKDVIEAKIPLMYLGNPSEVDITKLMGMLQTDSGWTQPDTMP